jgi:cysteine desulfurase
VQEDIVRHVYLDHAATTPIHPEVVEAMLPYLRDGFGNPSSLHHWGVQAKEAMDRARESVAALLGAQPEEVIFTGCGSESDNLAIFGTAYQKQDRGRHIITSAIEHHAVLHACQALEKRGWPVTYLPVDEYGLVDPAAVAKAITDQTVLVTIMHANNEVGTIEPIAEIGAICKEKGVTFHVDAVQTVGHIPTDVNELNCDLLALSAHKFHGPKGVGALYLRKGTKVVPLIYGGGHERGLRSGTENVAGIVGTGKAAELMRAEMPTEMPRLTELRDATYAGLQERIPDLLRTGHPTRRLPNNVSVCIRYIEGESMLLNLDMQGIGASSGSACTSGTLDPSHVLLAMGLPHEIAHGSLRLTTGRDTTREDMDYLLDVLPPIVEKLRMMSPLYAAREAS